MSACYICSISFIHDRKILPHTLQRFSTISIWNSKNSSSIHRPTIWTSLKSILKRQQQFVPQSRGKFPVTVTIQQFKNNGDKNYMEARLLGGSFVISPWRETPQDFTEPFPERCYYKNHPRQARPQALKRRVLKAVQGFLWQCWLKTFWRLQVLVFPHNSSSWQPPNFIFRQTVKYTGTYMVFSLFLHL